MAYIHPIHTPRGLSLLGGDVAASSIGGLALWLDASRLPSYEDNTPLPAGWPDLSGFGRHLSNVNKPAYRTNRLNGLPTVLFDGDNDALTGTPPSGLTTLTLTVVLKTTYAGAGTSKGIFGIAATGGNSYDIDGLGLTNSNDLASIVLYGANATNDLDVAVPVTNDTFTLVTYVVSATSVATFKNGAASNTDTLTARTFSGDLMLLGGVIFEGGAAQHAAFELAELAMWSRALTTAERQAIEGALATKYGLTLA